MMPLRDREQHFDEASRTQYDTELPVLSEDAVPVSRYTDPDFVSRGRYRTASSAPSEHALPAPRGTRKGGQSPNASHGRPSAEEAARLRRKRHQSTHTAYRSGLRFSLLYEKTLRQNPDPPEQPITDHAEPQRPLDGTRPPEPDSGAERKEAETQPVAATTSEAVREEARVDKREQDEQSASARALDEDEPHERPTVLAARWGTLYPQIAAKPLPEAIARIGVPPSYHTRVAKSVIQLLQALAGHEHVTEEEVLAAEGVFQRLVGPEGQARIAPMIERGLAASRLHASTSEGIDASQLLYLSYAILRQVGYGDDPDSGLDLAGEMMTVAVRELRPNHSVPSLPEGANQFLAALSIGFDVKAKMEEARAEGQHELQAFCTAVADTFLHRAVKVGLVALAGFVAAVPGVGPLASAILTAFAGNITQALLQPLPEPDEREEESLPNLSPESYDADERGYNVDYREKLPEETGAPKEPAGECRSDTDRVYNEHEHELDQQRKDPWKRGTGEQSVLEQMPDQQRPKPVEDWWEEEKPASPGHPQHLDQHPSLPS